MKRIDGTHLVILDQTFHNGDRYVKVQDLIEYFENGLTAYQNDRQKTFPTGEHKGKPIHKEYKRAKISLCKFIIQAMKDLDTNDRTIMGVPNRYITETKE